VEPFPLLGRCVVALVGLGCGLMALPILLVIVAAILILLCALLRA
jgi:hypothetical protein